MQVKEERLLLFMKLYKEEFGVELTRSQAHEKASLVLQYAMLCMKPLAKLEEYEIMSVSNVSE